MLEVRALDESAVQQLTRELRVHAVTARCLVARGVTDTGMARGFLDPKLGLLRRPEGDVAMAGFAVAADRLAAAVLRGEMIAVFGDYDVDGVTTCALFTGYLRACGARVHGRVARRDEGYGFSEAAATELIGKQPKVIVLGDCGTSDHDTIARARRAGIDVIVVDHHTVPVGDVHPATALVNPHRRDSSFPFRGMASVGIGFYLAAAVRTRLKAQGWFRTRTEPDPRDQLDLVAIGTIADLVPLHRENRILASHGLKLLGERKRPGLAALLDVAGVVVGDDRPIDEKTVSWKLAPRLNAPGRLGDAGPALDLLMSSDGEAVARAAGIEESNQARRAAQDQAVAEAMAQIGDGDPGPAVVLASDRWPAGVVGIVAAKLVDRFQRPAFVISIDPATGIGRGSARSAGGVNLYRALGQCAAMLERFGGHAAAAGMTVRAGEVDRLREALGAAVLAEGSGPVTGQAADAVVAIGDIDETLARELGELAPFGQDNPQPLLVSKGVAVRATRRVGDGSHLKMELGDRGIAAIGFGLGEHDPGAGAVVDLAYTPVVSTWQGRTRVELEVKRVAKAGAAR